MSSTSPSSLLAAVVACALALATAQGSAVAQWRGLVDRSDDLGTERFDFGVEGGGNENYYDGDFGDFDGDGVPDRALTSRYGLLWNAGGGELFPVSTQVAGQPPNSRESLTGYLFGDEVSIGNDAVEWADVDGDGDLDSLQGGNGERFVIQENRQGRFSILRILDGSALNIVPTDLERDGDVDFLVAHAFCTDSPDPGCGGPLAFSVFVNDGAGDFTEEAASRGLDLGDGQIAGVVSGDVDGDGDFDALLLYGATDSLAICDNDGAGSFACAFEPFASRLSVSGFGQHMGLGDIDGDGDLDLAIVMGRYTGTHPRVGHVIMVNDGAGAFTEESDTRFVVPDQYAFLGRLIAGNGKLVDLDYDGDLDFVAFSMEGAAALHLQVFLNDGAGVFSYDQSWAPPIPIVDTALGNDTDVTDLDADGDLDLWIGSGGALVHILLNDYDPPDGVRPDVPRDLEVASAEAGGVTLSWRAPPFAANVRHYVVYRSVAPGLEPRDRQRIKIVARSRHEDEGFSAPIGPLTTTADLDDPDVAIDAGTIRFTDRTVAPGVTYYYSVAHVGTESTVGAPTRELRADVPAPGGEDVVGPALRIAGPSDQSWSAFPRIVLEYADGGSGVDRETLQVSLDGGPDVTRDAFRKDDNAFVTALREGQGLPLGLSRLTASVADRAGNRTEAAISFAVSVAPDQPPTAVADVSPTTGSAPLIVSFDGAASSDPDGLVMRTEWYFGDARSATGRRVAHCFGNAGTYDVVLLVRDDEGGVGTAEASIDVQPGDGEPCPDDVRGDDGDGGDADADADTDADADGDSDGDGGPPRVPAQPLDSGCGCRTPGGGAGPLGLLLGAALFALRPGSRRR